MDSSEHPYLAEALAAAEKLELPNGWIAQVRRGAEKLSPRIRVSGARSCWTVVHARQETEVEGEVERYYCHPLHRWSGWDHPLLRTCLWKVLLRDKHVDAAAAVLALSPVRNARDQLHVPTSQDGALREALVGDGFGLQQAGQLEELEAEYVKSGDDGNEEDGSDGEQQVEDDERTEWYWLEDGRRNIRTHELPEDGVEAEAVQSEAALLTSAQADTHFSLPGGRSAESFDSQTIHNRSIATPPILFRSQSAGEGGSKRPTSATSLPSRFYASPPVNDNDGCESNAHMSAPLLESTATLRALRSSRWYQSQAVSVRSTSKNSLRPTFSTTARSRAAKAQFDNHGEQDLRTEYFESLTLKEKQDAFFSQLRETQGSDFFAPWAVQKTKWVPNDCSFLAPRKTDLLRCDWTCYAAVRQSPGVLIEQTECLALDTES